MEASKPEEEITSTKLSAIINSQVKSTYILLKATTLTLIHTLPFTVKWCRRKHLQAKHKVDTKWWYVMSTVQPWTGNSFIGRKQITSDKLCGSDNRQHTEWNQTHEKLIHMRHRQQATQRVEPNRLEVMTYATPTTGKTLIGTKQMRRVELRYTQKREHTDCQQTDEDWASCGTDNRQHTDLNQADDKCGIMEHDQQARHTPSYFLPYFNRHFQSNVVSSHYYQVTALTSIYHGHVP